MSAFTSRLLLPPVRRLLSIALLAMSAAAAAQSGTPARAEPNAKSGAAPNVKPNAAKPDRETNTDWRNTWRTPAQGTPSQGMTPPDALSSGDNAAMPFSMTTNKGFSAAIRLAEKTEAERFIREWNENASNKLPTLKSSDHVARGQSVVLLVLYAGCSAKAEGPAPCAATLEVKTLDPHGKVLMEQFDVPLARGVPAYPNVLQLSPVTLQTDFEASDIDGMYRYDVTLRNPERNAVITLTDTIVLGAKPVAP